MKKNFILLSAVCVLGTFISFKPPAGPPDHPVPAKAGDLRIEIMGLRNAKGYVLISMYCNEDGFPTKVEKACWKGQETSRNGKVEILRKDLAAGTYAVAVLHDENSNLKMDTRLLGLPKEGYGFSQNPRLLLGPPSFKSASIQHDGNQTITINMKY